MSLRTGVLRVATAIRWFFGVPAVALIAIGGWERYEAIGFSWGIYKPVIPYFITAGVLWAVGYGIAWVIEGFAPEDQVRE